MGRKVIQEQRFTGKDINNVVFQKGPFQIERTISAKVPGQGIALKEDQGARVLE